jgi:hypothetical protein
MVSIVIANYNGSHFLKLCLDSLREQTYHNIEIIVVDNGSSDNSVEMLQRDYPEVRIIQNKKNLGFVSANNQGFRASHGQYILFLNNDTKVDRFFLERLITEITGREKEIGVVFSKLLLFNEPDRLDAIGSFLTNYGFLYHIGFQEKDHGQYNNLEEIFSPKGVCFLMPKKLLEEIGAFDEDYFSYFEESDLFWRVWLSARKIRFVPRSIVYHRVGGTCTRLPSHFIDFHSFKNRICTLIKNLGTANLFKILPVHLLLCLGMSFLYLCNLRIKNGFSILKALGWNLFNLKSTLKKRKVIQRHIRKVNDKDLLRKIKRNIPLFRFLKFTKVYLRRW